MSSSDQTGVGGFIYPYPRKWCLMSCAVCISFNEAEFTAEVMIHFCGLKHLANPGVFVFPRVLVCLDCGFSRCTTPESELQALGKGIEVRKAV